MVTTMAEFSNKPTRKVGESFQIEQEKLALLRELCRRLQRPKAAILREAVDLVLEKYKQSE